jgi:hypothetical protein
MERKPLRGFTENELAAALFSKQFKSQQQEAALLTKENKLKSSSSSSSSSYKYNHHDDRELGRVRGEGNSRTQRYRSPNSSTTDLFGRDLPRRETDRDTIEVGRRHERRSRERERERYKDHRDHRDDESHDRRRGSRSRSPSYDRRRNNQRRNNNPDDIVWIHDRHTVDEPE